jgi:hypothetical protein
MMWAWWIAQLAFIFLVDIFRYIAIGVIVFWVAKNILRRFARR